jgi:hypothetical protein
MRVSSLWYKSSIRALSPFGILADDSVFMLSRRVMAFPVSQGQQFIEDFLQSGRFLIGCSTASTMAFFGRSAGSSEINALWDHINVNNAPTWPKRDLFSLSPAISKPPHGFESRKFPPGAALCALLTDPRDMDCLYQAIMYLLATIEKGRKDYGDQFTFNSDE